MRTHSLDYSLGDFNNIVTQRGAKTSSSYQSDCESSTPLINNQMNIHSPQDAQSEFKDETSILAAAVDEEEVVVIEEEHAPHAVPWWKLVFAWQALAVLLTGTGVFSQLLANKGFSIPTTQSCMNYFLLSLHGIHLIRRRQELPAAYTKDQPVLRVAWWKYLILAFFDIEGNYCLVRAYQYTTIASVQLLDCFTIPSVMVLSLLFLKVQFNRKHITGCVLCLIGLVILVVSDVNNKQPATDPLRGDLLVFLGCILYSISNVAQEHIVKNHDTIEFLTMLGCFGFLISIIQVLLFERQLLSQVDWTDPEVCLYILGFNSCLFGLYISIPRLLVLSSAVFMNLSFLTADFWALIFGVFLFSNSVTVMYFVAFGIIITGLITYNLADHDILAFKCCNDILSCLGLSSNNPTNSIHTNSSSRGPAIRGSVRGAASASARVKQHLAGGMILKDHDDQESHGRLAGTEEENRLDEDEMTLGLDMDTAIISVDHEGEFDNI